MGRHAVRNRDLVTTPKIKAMTPRHRAICRLVSSGVTPGQIAEQYGLTCSRVSAIVNSPLFLAELRRLEEGEELAYGDAQVELNSLVPQAIEVFADMLDAPPNPATQLKVATEVLDRTGYGRKLEVDHKGNITIDYSGIPMPGDNPDDYIDITPKNEEELLG